MIVVPNQLYSFHYSQVPGFERIYELSRQHSYAPVGFDELQFEKLPRDHRLFARRATLDDVPDEQTILQQEQDLAKSKGDRSTSSRSRDVESQQIREIIEAVPRFDPSDATNASADLARSSLKHREASGYVKLDQRKTRLAELTEEVSQFFGSSCRCQGDYWYPRGGFRDWHTNKYDATGWRLYIVDVDNPGGSYFRIKDPRTNEIVTLPDQPGTFNFFLIDPERLLWHCIGSPNANRWSKGFIIPETWLDSVVANLK